jgi:predicted nucleotide-binding protein (sugar kinase/HSP70/actin superfamily)
MKKIDFRHFKMFTDISQSRTEEIDITLMFSDMLYKRVNGIVAHDLALRIYRASEPVEFSEEEMGHIKAFVETNFTPCFIDSFDANIA